MKFYIFFNNRRTNLMSFQHQLLQATHSIITASIKIISNLTPTHFHHLLTDKQTTAAKRRNIKQKKSKKKIPTEEHITCNNNSFLYLVVLYIVDH